ncbi:MAG: hypothetical protein RIS86_816 [Planctomycetota bacterium]
MTHAANRLARRSFRAFTLTELLIAVGVLVVVIVAAAKIFSASSKVTAVAEANAEILQTANAIESQIRADIANLPKNAFLIVQQVEVNPEGTIQTVDPSLGSAEIRADQLAFFTRGVKTTTQYSGSQESIAGVGVAQTWTPESAVARVYYGHGVLASTLPVGFGPTTYEDTNAPLVPWRGGRVETQRWDTGQFGAAANVPATKASLWPLVRLATLLQTDGGVNPAFASAGVNASMRLFTSRQTSLGPLSTVNVGNNDPLWTTGRVDVVKWQMDDLLTQHAYQWGANGAGGGGIPFTRLPNDVHSASSVRLRMLQTLGPWASPATAPSPANGSAQLYVAYPRVEKSALGASRAEQMLTAPVLAANCSSFKVEWTWGDGVGRTWRGNAAGSAPAGGERIGMYVAPGAAQPWFGLDDTRVAIAQSAVKPVSNNAIFVNNPNFGPWGTIGPPLVIGDLGSSDLVCSVEGPVNRSGDAQTANKPVWRTSPAQDSKRVYQAVFGFNQEDTGVIDPGASPRGPYTPLPSALRITLRLHDPLGRIEGGREYQFIVDLPKR